VLGNIAVAATAELLDKSARARGIIVFCAHLFQSEETWRRYTDCIVIRIIADAECQEE